VDARIRELGELVDSWLRQEVQHAVSEPAQRFGGMLEYHFGWRDTNLQRLEKRAPAGKRLRPVLTLLVSEAVSGVAEDARDAAIAVELIHNFSLVHDDIQDRSAMRHHRQTLWTVWGMPQGINAGDALFALAQVVLLRTKTDLAAQLAVELNRTALSLSEGQFLDIALQNGDVPATLEVYESMIARKTGALFACACRLGAMSAGAPRAAQDAYADYGLELGLAFQEQDDLLGIWGASSETGKPDAADVLERKRGLPAALALSEPNAPDWLKRLFDDEGGDVPPETVERVVAHFDALDLRARIQARVEARYQRALECLHAAQPRQPAGGYLAAICESLVARRA
ncbi:MAG: polyprenyl synthetase family protein, partial [Chloroflexi bacterium]|nr:polyprenyl synthetase family protein [Chloroflexota bacterium]